MKPKKRIIMLREKDQKMYPAPVQDPTLKDDSTKSRIISKVVDDLPEVLKVGQFRGFNPLKHEYWKNSLKTIKSFKHKSKPRRWVAAERIPYTIIEEEESLKRKFQDEKCEDCVKMCKT